MGFYWTRDGTSSSRFCSFTSIRKDYMKECECFLWDPDSDCVLGNTAGPSDCTRSCGTVHQSVTTISIGNGKCKPDTYECEPGDGKCPSIFLLISLKFDLRWTYIFFLI